MTPSASQTIVLIGDTHDDPVRLARSLALVDGRPADLVLLTGDIGRDPPWHVAQRRTHRADHDDSVRSVLARVRSVCECPLVFVPGNHDLADPPRDVEAVNADRRIVEVLGLRIAGFGGAGPTRFGFPYEWSEAEAEAALACLLSGEGAGEIDVFLAHSPPFGSTLDRTTDGRHVGSQAVRRWIARSRPRLFVCGHIHEAWGVEWLEGVPCVNAGALGEPFGQNLAWVVEWSDGPLSIRAVRDAEPGISERVWKEPR